MATDAEQAALRSELQSLDSSIERLRAELRELGDDLREPDDGATASRMATEAEELLDSLEARRNELRRRLGQMTSEVAASPSPSPSRRVGEPDDDEPSYFEDDPATLGHEGWGEDIDPAVWPEEWTARRGDQISEAADVDDPVEALEVGALSAGTEASSDDATELADNAAPAPPEEAAFTEGVGVSAEDEDLTVGLPPAVDLDRLEAASFDDLVEAELIAIDAGDPETSAIIAAELERRRARGRETGPGR